MAREAHFGAPVVVNYLMVFGLPGGHHYHLAPFPLNKVGLHQTGDQTLVLQIPNIR